MTVAAVRRTDPSALDRPVVVLAGCAAVALASLAVPATLGYDPWAWLVWGREVGGWSLDTTGGPSWKPLPVGVTTLLAPLGGLAVPAYAVLARTAALAGVVAVARLAGRLGGPAAAAVAAASLLLVPDGDPRFLRLVLEGHEAPWSMGLAAAGLLALVDRRPGRALAWTWLLALLRPEAWPFLLVLVAWPAGWRMAAGRPGPVNRSVRRLLLVERANRSVRSSRVVALRDGRPLARWGLGALASIPLLWFVPDWLGAGSPVQGAGHARVLADEAVLIRLGDSVGTAAGMVPVPVWVLAAVALVRARRRPDGVPAALGLAALAWTALVVGMAALLGYAAISRFFLPAAGVVCVLAATAVVPVLRHLRAAGRPAVAAAGLVTATLVTPRVVGIADVAAEVADRARLHQELHEVIDDAGGVDVVTRCDAAVVTGRTLLRSAAAWTLELPLRRVERTSAGGPAVLLLTDERAIRRARASGTAVELAAAGRWTAFADRCPAAR